MAAAPDRAVLRNLEQGLTLPASWYSDPEILKLEHERIFSRSWQYAGVAGDVAESGAFFTCRAGAVPIVVVRGRDGELRGFVNVCRHRGHEVAHGCGRRETLQCPYHAWTYDLDGSLRAAPRSEREPGFDNADWGLLPVLVDTWGPLVFVNPSLDAAPLGETLGDLPTEVAQRGLDPSALEYRGRSREVDADSYRLTTARWTSSQIAQVRDVQGRPYDPVGEIVESQFHYIWPNWTLNTLPGPPHVRVLVFQPLDAERTATFVDGFWATDTPDEVIEEITAFGTVVGLEDTVLVESVHRGLRSGALEHGRLIGSSEQLLQHFQRLVYDALADPA